jgi:predicted transcriptional regulator YdeE
MLVAVAEEKNLSMEDKAAMHGLGVKIGKNLLNEKCQGFMQLAMKMAQNNEGESSSIGGKFKRIDNKGFNYIVVVDDDNQEKSFLWLQQFTGSENFMKNTITLAGKKLKIDWKEIEVYLPESKGYYKVKEITAITIL